MIPTVCGVVPGLPGHPGHRDTTTNVRPLQVRHRDIADVGRTSSRPELASHPTAAGCFQLATRQAWRLVAAEARLLPTTPTLSLAVTRGCTDVAAMQNGVERVDVSRQPTMSKTNVTPQESTDDYGC